MDDGGKHIAGSLWEGTAVALSDGSFKHPFGMALWVIEGETNRNRVQGNATTPGTRGDQSACWSEPSGLFCVALAVHVVCDHCTVTSLMVPLKPAATAQRHCAMCSKPVCPPQRTISTSIWSSPPDRQLSKCRFWGVIGVQRDIRQRRTNNLTNGVHPTKKRIC